MRLLPLAFFSLAGVAAVAACDVAHGIRANGPTSPISDRLAVPFVAAVATSAVGATMGAVLLTDGKPRRRKSAQRVTLHRYRGTVAGWQTIGTRDSAGADRLRSTVARIAPSATLRTVAR